MSRKFKIWDDPYDNGWKMYKKRTIEIKPGVTVLVGCNGIGKSTLLHCLRDSLKEEKVPYMTFDNLKDGGSNAKASAFYEEDFSFVATSAMSSEGENIILNMNRIAQDIGRFVRIGSKKEKYDLSALFQSEEEREKIKKQRMDHQERWILLDATDSGLSIDNVMDIKEYLFKTILENSCGKDVYILVAANEYEMCCDENCFDVYAGKYVKFKSYDEYKELILRSREDKNKRGKKQ